MRLNEEEIKRIAKKQGYAAIWPRLFPVFALLGLITLMAAIQVVSYYSCYYTTPQIWEKLASILIPATIGGASLILAVAGAAPKIIFAIGEVKGKGFYVYPNKEKPVGMKQHLDLINETGLPVKLKLTTYLGHKTAEPKSIEFDSGKVIEHEYKYADEGILIKIAPRDGIRNGSFVLKDVENYKEGDLLLIEISAKTAFAGLSKLYRLWYYDPKYEKWIPDLFFKTIQ